MTYYVMGCSLYPRALFLKAQLHILLIDNAGIQEALEDSLYKGSQRYSIEPMADRPCLVLLVGV